MSPRATTQRLNSDFQTQKGSHMGRPTNNNGLRRLCQSYQVDINDIACYCGVNRRSVSKYLNGRPSPRLEKKMSDLFKVSVSALRKKLGTDKHFTPKAGPLHKTSRVTVGARLPHKGPASLFDAGDRAKSGKRASPADGNTSATLTTTRSKTKNDRDKKGIAARNRNATRHGVRTS